MRGVLKDASDMPLSVVTRTAIVDGRERRAKTPSKASNINRKSRSWCGQEDSNCR